MRRASTDGQGVKTNQFCLPDTGMAGMSTHSRVAEIVDMAHGGHVADVGAGLGSFTDWLLDRGYNATAVDIDAARYRGKAPFLPADIDRGLPFSNASLDGIIAIEVIEHLENPYGFVRDAARCLKIGGRLILTTPNITSVSSKLSLVFRGYPIYFGADDFIRNGHISPVSLLDIQRIASRTGFAVDLTTYNVGRLPIPKIRHWLPLRGRPFRNEWWGDSLIVKLRKTSSPLSLVNRG